MDAALGYVEIAISTEDITLQKEIERLELLTAELQHRIKNLFGVVLSIIQYQSSLGLPPSEEIHRIRNCIISMASTYGEPSIKRKDGFLLLKELILQVTSNNPNSNRIAISGAEFRLSEPTWLPIAMIIHELTINSFKYGALSDLKGIVDVSWSRVSDGFLELTWDELVFQRRGSWSTRKSGFGSKLLEACVKQLNGSIDISVTEPRLKAKIVVGIE